MKFLVYTVLQSRRAFRGRVFELDAAGAADHRVAAHPAPDECSGDSAARQQVQHLQSAADSRIKVWAVKKEVHPAS